MNFTVCLPIKRSPGVFINFAVWKWCALDRFVLSDKVYCCNPIISIYCCQLLIPSWLLHLSRFFCGIAKEWVIIIIIIIGIQPLGRSGQRLEFSQTTGMALVRCILGKFLGVVCHCFPPLFRCSHFSPPGASTSTMTWEIPGAEVGTMGENVVR